MQEILQVNTSLILPAAAEVIERQGVPPQVLDKPEFISMAENTVEIFENNSKPAAVIEDITIDDFENIFLGEGFNHTDAPLKNIFPHAEGLALFAVTMGAEVCGVIEECFLENDFAKGYMLDTTASIAADKSVQYLESLFEQGLETFTDDCAVLSYSPGYCGWHISAQKKLFAKLRPERIDISLNSSFLMTPIKSVTGVLINCETSRHIFRNQFDFCGDCKAKSCVDRFNKIKN